MVDCALAGEVQFMLESLLTGRHKMTIAWNASRNDGGDKGIVINCSQRRRMRERARGHYAVSACTFIVAGYDGLLEAHEIHV